MKSHTVNRAARAIALIVPLLCAPLAAQEMPQPVKEHEWLSQFAGEWESEMECTFEPGKPPVKSKGSEKARLLGPFWVVAEGSGDAMGTPFSSILTLGYDTDKKKYIGTWIDSMMNRMWHYEGTLNEAGDTLTLETEGPCVMHGGQTRKFREIIVFKSKDHKTFTSQILGDDGAWTTMVTVDSKRK